MFVKNIGSMLNDHTRGWSYVKDSCGNQGENINDHMKTNDQW